MDVHLDDTGDVVGQTAIVLLPILPGQTDQRDATDRLMETCGLAEAIELTVLRSDIINISSPTPATLFGTGKVKQLLETIDADGQNVSVVIVDALLSPVQHRNLENAWHAKVLDRTALILEIFGDRAQTAEGRLQVDLAHLTFQRSRLVRSWTHLERQRGGAGFLGGPGERQIESDRRALANKIDRLTSKLEQVRRTRSLQRSKRKKSDMPVVALVGYTNAGKSTLFNHVTGARILAKDMLFATLDPTMRSVTLPSGQDVILSDTVGFISNLPTQLIAAFRATLEEVIDAEIIVHVRDISHRDSLAQRDDVIDVLGSLGIDYEEERPVIEVFNKADLLSYEEINDQNAVAKTSRERELVCLNEPLIVTTSATTGDGVDEFLELIDVLVTANRTILEVSLKPQDGAARAWLHERGDVLSDKYSEHGSKMIVRLNDEAQGQFMRAFPYIAIERDDAIMQTKKA